MDLCEYGCGQEAKFVLKNGKKCCSLRRESCSFQRKLTSEKIKQAHIKKEQETGSKLFEKGSRLSTTENVTFDVNICFYCGKKSNFILKNGKGCCESNANKCPENKLKNSTSVKKAHEEGRISTEHLELYREWWLYKKPEEVQNSRKKQGSTYSKRLKSGEIVPYFLGKKHSLESKQKMSNAASERNSGFVKTKYYKIYCPYMNKEVSVQGTWEYKYASYLNDNNINWERSKTKHLNYKLYEEDYIHSYYPDFFLPDTRTYVEIKGFWWISSDGRVDDKRKMRKVIECNIDKTIIILEKGDLEKLGIIL